MTKTTEAQARAIAQALGWNELIYDHDNTSTWWFHSRYGQLRGARAPRLTDDTMLGRAMCYDAIEWLILRDADILWSGDPDKPWWISMRGGNTDTFSTLPAALEAAMIKELGL